MDILMPEMDGFEATRAIRKHLGDSVKIIALSASTFEEERDRIIRSGCDDMMHKPFVRSTLLETLQEHLHLNYRYLSAGTRYASAAPEPATPLEVQLPAELAAALLEHLEVGDIDTAITTLEAINAPETGKKHVLELLNAFRIDEALSLLKTQSQP
jgi:DNA-binding response OmpR family regulator